MFRPTLAAALALAALAVPSAASAAWTAPTDLSNTGQHAQRPEVALDAAGNSVTVWDGWDGGNSRVFARRLSAAGVPGPIETLGDKGIDAGGPEVAVDPAGNAVVVWQAGAVIQAQQLSAAGLPGPVVNLTAAVDLAREPQVGIDAAGDAVLTWVRFDGTHDVIDVVRLSAAGVLSKTRVASDTSVNSASPQVAVAPAGEAALTWTTSDGVNLRVAARGLSATGKLSALWVLSGGGADARRSQVAIDAAANALVTWERFDGANYVIQARWISASGGPAGILGVSGATGFDANWPQVSVDGAGHGFVVWQRSDGADDRVEASPLVGGVAGGVLRLSMAGEPAWGARVGSDAVGRALVSFQRFDGTNARVETRSFDSSGGFNVVQSLSDAGGNAVGAELAVNAGGGAAVAWSRKDAVDNMVQIVTGP